MSKKNKKKKDILFTYAVWIFVLLFLSFSILIGVLFYQRSYASQIYDITNNIETNNQLEEAKYIRAKDGDTIVVSINGIEKTVRLLEIDCPESVHPLPFKNTIEGKLASEFTKSLLEKNQTIYLSKDTSDTDKYGRLLRLVWLSKPTNLYDEMELKTKCLNAYLLLNGHAKVAIYDDKKYETVFRKFEAEYKAIVEAMK